MTQPVIIQKYGGSSVATLEKLEMVARRVVEKHREGYGVVVVVSAMGNTTDALLLRASQIMSDPPARELDMLLTTGERTTMALLSIAIQKYGAQAISFTGSQAGIVTTDSHANAKIISVRPYRVQDELARDRIVIVAGFQGTSYKNEITTLGRGGSDMTAVALAGALGAVACEIYSDVDGVYSADPKVVLDAKRFDELTSAQMLEMAQYGAKVLHDEAILYAHKHQIALYAKKSHAALDEGTYIRPDGWPEDALEASKMRALSVVSAKRVAFVLARGDVGKFLACLSLQDGMKVIGMSSDGERICSLIDVWNCADAGVALEGLALESGMEVSWALDCRNVSLVGHDIGRSAVFMAQCHRALSEAGIGVMAVFSQSNAVTFVVGEGDVGAASRLMHAFV